MDLLLRTKKASLILLIIALMLTPGIPRVRGFYDTNWSRARRFYIQASDIDEDLTDFPVLVYLDSSRINWTETQDDLDDIRFVDQGNTTFLDYEIENYTVNNEAWLWVNFPFVNSTSNTIFYLYYGNPTASSSESPTDVWDSDYITVLHMNDLTTSTLEDSTINSHDMTKGGANQPALDPGMIDGAQYFDGVDDDVVSDATYQLADTITWEFWCNSTDDATPKTIWSDNAQWHTQGYIWFGRSTSLTQLYYEYANTTHTLSWNVNNFFLEDTYMYGTIVVNYTSDTYEVYRNGVSQATGSMPNAISLSGYSRSQYVGTFSGGNHFFLNELDEIRVSQVNRSDAYIKASYESGRDRLVTYSTTVEYYPPLTNPCAIIHPDDKDNAIEQLMYGDGRVLGLMIVIALVVFISVKTPLGVISIIPLFLLAFTYYNRAQCVPELFWYFIASLLTMGFSAVISLVRGRT
jgi:hypothetical protein